VALPSLNRPEWRVSVRWWIGGDGIMRCRSRSRPEKVLGGPIRLIYGLRTDFVKPWMNEKSCPLFVP
jgi:hypothetical protein